MTKKAFCALFALMACATTQVMADVIEVTGKIEGLKKGRLHMVAQMTETRVDTLVTIDFKGSKFSLKAEIGEPLVAQLVVDGYAGGFTFIAQPGAKYEALLKNEDGAYIKGGSLHDAWQDYIREDAARQAKKQELQRRYDALRQQNRFRSASAVNDSLKAYSRELAAATEAFLNGHDDIITAHTYQSHAVQSDAPLRVSKNLYNKMGEGAKASLSGRLMKERIDRMEKSVAGRPAPDFTLSDVDGNPVTLSAVKGKLKILDFWASWCGPCRLNNPHLKGLYEKYHDKGLEVIGVSLDSKREPWLNAIKKDGLPWINVSPLSGMDCEVARAYSVTAIPAVFVISEKNEIVATNLRGEALDNFLKEQFGE